MSDLFSHLEQKRLHFPFLAKNSAGTVGGMVSTGQIRTATGAYSISRWVLALNVAMASGEIIRTGAVTYKSVAGYDLPKLFCGSFGTLGVVVEATLRLYPNGSGPFGKDLKPRTVRNPLLGEIAQLPMAGNRSTEISRRIKIQLDPNGMFPALIGWNTKG